MTNLSERSLYKPVLSLFAPNYDVIAEVPFSRKRVDLVFKNENGSTLIAVELKLSNWKKALSQAATNQLFADFSYVAIANGTRASKMDQDVVKWFHRLGVGLIVVNEVAKIMLQPVQSGSVVENHRRTVLDVIHEAAHSKTMSREEFNNGTPAAKPRTTAFLPAGTY